MGLDVEQNEHMAEDEQALPPLAPFYTSSRCRDPPYAPFFYTWRPAGTARQEDGPPLDPAPSPSAPQALHEECFKLASHFARCPPQGGGYFEYNASSDAAEARGRHEPAAAAQCLAEPTTAAAGCWNEYGTDAFYTLRQAMADPSSPQVQRHPLLLHPQPLPSPARAPHDTPSPPPPPRIPA